jgi:hypothetical protein
MAGRILIYTFKSDSGKDVLMVIIGAQVAIVNVFLLVKQILQTPRRRWSKRINQ